MGEMREGETGEGEMEGYIATYCANIARQCSQPDPVQIVLFVQKAKFKCFTLTTHTITTHSH